jgi:hypothetical protein
MRPARVTIRCCASPDAVSRRRTAFARARTAARFQGARGRAWSPIDAWRPPPSGIGNYVLESAATIVTKDDGLRAVQGAGRQGPGRGLDQTAQNALVGVAHLFDVALNGHYRRWARRDHGRDHISRGLDVLVVARSTAPSAASGLQGARDRPVPRRRVNFARTPSCAPRISNISICSAAFAEDKPRRRVRDRRRP